MAIPKCVLTKKGAALLAKTPAGTEIPVTRWQMGTGSLPASESLEDMVQLVRPLKYLPIASVTSSGRQALVLGQFVNEGMDAFVWEELGCGPRTRRRGKFSTRWATPGGTGISLKLGRRDVSVFPKGNTE